MKAVPSDRQLQWKGVAERGDYGTVKQLREDLDQLREVGYYPSFFSCSPSNSFRPLTSLLLSLFFPRPFLLSFSSSPSLLMILYRRRKRRWRT